VTEARDAFRQITHDDLGCASYLIGDEREGSRSSRIHVDGLAEWWIAGEG
jgi:hypothetical protein